MKADVIVLGAGMVGVSTALQLQRKGRDVALVDRRGAAEETSFGNAGIIQREGVVPYMFPREWATILRYARNTSSDAYYHLSALPGLAPWMLRYFLASTPEGKERSARAMLPLIERCIIDHEDLMGEAGVSGMIRRTGYVRVYRTSQALDTAAKDDEAERRLYGIGSKVLDPAGLAELEPHLSHVFAGGVLLTDPVSVGDPGALGVAYAELFKSRGGRFVEGEAKSLEVGGVGWRVATRTGWLEAPEVVVALGPWSSDVTRPLGLKIPLGWKRGYHMHYRTAGNATLSRPVIDAESGFCLTSMTKGIRLTTGAEFAARDAPPTPVQLGRSEAKAREIFPITDRVDDQPWLGRRPCLPDMVPVIGKAPGRNGLWLNFGHQHLGFTLGPSTGLLLAQMMTGEAPYADPAPYRADRF
ncbi:MAG: FAD-binding oxidoreductase [Hyphomicrobiaceae bacterium]